MFPTNFGAWQSIWERHRRWFDDGTYMRMSAAGRDAAPENDARLERLFSGDSILVRAHEPSVGA